MHCQDILQSQNRKLLLQILIDTNQSGKLFLSEYHIHLQWNRLGKRFHPGFPFLLKEIEKKLFFLRPDCLLEEECYVEDSE